MWNVIHGSCLDEMPKLEAESVHSIVTDAPYGLGKIPDPEKMLLAWLSGQEYIPGNGGFMGREWDAFIPGPRYWREAIRVLKPGGYLLCFAGTRTVDLMGLAIRLAGFEIRDQISFNFGSGFPKSINISKALGDRICRCEDGSEAQMLDEHQMRSVFEANLSKPGQVENKRGQVLLEGLPQQDSQKHWSEGFESETSRAEQSSVEGRSNLFQEKWELQECEIRSLPEADASNGQKGRLRDGASLDNGDVDRASSNQGGSSASHRSQPGKQRKNKSGALAEQQLAQKSGAWEICRGCGKPIITPGLGSATKPAHEPIIVARKPFTGTLVQNVLEHGTGAMNIDACRVAHANADDLAAHKSQVEAIKARGGSMADSWKNSSDLSGASDVTTAGRFPANLLLQHSDGCVKVGLKTITSNPTWDTPNRETESTFTGDTVSQVRHADADSDFEETIAKWHCADGCPVKLMDEQNEEGASRFFQQFELDDFDLDPFYYCPKPSRAERDGGLSDFKPATGGEATGRKDGSAGALNPRAGSGGKGGSRNIHPTVKSIALMRYLCRLVTPPGGTVLDPFCGSGSTGCGAVLEGFNFIGIELNDTKKEPFVSIARARIAHVLSSQYLAGKKTQTATPVAAGQMSLF